MSASGALHVHRYWELHRRRIKIVNCLWVYECLRMGQVLDEGAPTC